MIGCLIVAWLADKVGRKRGVQIICALCIVSAIIQGASVHIAMFLIGRFLNGIGWLSSVSLRAVAFADFFSVGMIDVIVPIYQSEVSPAQNRGRMVGTHGFLVVCGYVGTLHCGSCGRKTDFPSSGWSWLDWIGMLLPIESCNTVAAVLNAASCGSSTPPHGLALGTRVAALACT